MAQYPKGKKPNLFGTIFIIFALILAIIMMLNSCSVVERLFNKAPPEDEASDTEYESIPDITPSEIGETGENTDSTRPKYNSFNCRVLSEDLHIVVLFADDDESSWTTEDVSYVTANIIEPGISFLKEQLSAYGSEAELQYSLYFSDESHSIKCDGIIDKNFIKTENENGDPLVYPTLDTASKDTLDRISAGWGFSTTSDMHTSLQEYTGTEQIAYMVMINKPGWSYACSEKDYEHGMIYAVDWYERDNGPSTFAHEFLHLFGAEDLYLRGTMDGETVNESRGELSKELNPNDIMFSPRADINENDIGGFTAYCVGLLDELPEEYNRPEWWM